VYKRYINNHMHQLGETPEEVDVIVQAMNPKYIKLLLDVAHYHQGGVFLQRQFYNIRTSLEHCILKM